MQYNNIYGGLIQSSLDNNDYFFKKAKSDRFKYPRFLKDYFVMRQWRTRFHITMYGRLYRECQMEYPDLSKVNGSYLFYDHCTLGKLETIVPVP